MEISDKIKSKILKTKFQIAKYTNEYKLVNETMIDAKAVVTAFVTFRSMEGSDRAIKIKDRLPKIIELIADYLGRKGGFLNSRPVINRAVGPDLVIWENLGVTYIQRLFYTVIVVFLSWLILLVTAFSLAKIRNLKRRELISCDDIQSVQQMIDDLTNTYTLFECFCDDPQRFTKATSQQFTRL